MTARNDLDLNVVLDRFLGEGPTEAPDDALDLALERVSTMRQRYGAPRRSFGMTTPVRLLAAAAILIAILVAGGIYLGSRPPTPEPLPSPVATAPAVAPSPVPSSSAAAIASASARPSAGPLPTPTPVPPIPALAIRALYAVDNGITGARQPGMLTVDDQSRLLELSDGVRFALDEQPDLPRALKAYPLLAAHVDELAPKLTGDRGDRLRRAVAVLGDILEAQELAPGAIDAGTYYSTHFHPTVMVTVPDGWTRRNEDGEVVAMSKGELTLAISKRATDVSADGLAKALGKNSADALADAPEPATLGAHKAFRGRIDGGGTLWFSEGLDPHDSKPGSEVRAWVVDVDGKPLTIQLDGPKAKVLDVLPEIETMLSTMQSI